MVCFSKTNQTIKHSVSPKDSPVPGRRAQTPSLAEFKQLRAGDTKMAVSLFICYQAWKEGLFFKCQPGILVIDRQSIVILGVLLVVSSPQLSSRRSFVLSWSYSLFLVLDLHGHRTMFTCSPFCCVVMFAARGIWWLTLTHIIMEPKKGRLQTNTIPFFLGLCLSAFVDYNELWSLMFAYFCRHWFCLMLALNRQIDCEKSWHTAMPGGGCASYQVPWCECKLLWWVIPTNCYSSWHMYMLIFLNWHSIRHLFWHFNWHNYSDV